MTSSIGSRRTIDSRDHPALLAWARLGGGKSLSDRVEIIKHVKKSSIYRVDGLAEIHRGVMIAKRADAGGIELEAMVYRDVLSELPVSSLRFFGTVPDDDPEFAWLFMEDAGEQRLAPGERDHTELLARW